MNEMYRSREHNGVHVDGSGEDLLRQWDSNVDEDALFPQTNFNQSLFDLQDEEGTNQSDRSISSAVALTCEGMRRDDGPQVEHSDSESEFNL